MRENAPTMILSEETHDCITFRFKGLQWALVTLGLGVGTLWLARRLHLDGHSPTWAVVIACIFGLLLLYSTIYSATATQWLTVSAGSKTVRFYKKNLYGLVEWERPAHEFSSIKIGRNGKSSNWYIRLICQDGLQLELGENAFGAFTQERAWNLASKISNRVGIIIEAPSLRNGL